MNKILFFFFLLLLTSCIDREPISVDTSDTDTSLEEIENVEEQVEQPNIQEQDDVREVENSALLACQASCTNGICALQENGEYLCFRKQGEEQEEPLPVMQCPSAMFNDRKCGEGCYPYQACEQYNEGCFSCVDKCAVGEIYKSQKACALIYKTVCEETTRYCYSRPAAEGFHSFIVGENYPGRAVQKGGIEEALAEG